MGGRLMNGWTFTAHCAYALHTCILGSLSEVNQKQATSIVLRLLFVIIFAIRLLSHFLDKTIEIESPKGVCPYYPFEHSAQIFVRHLKHISSSHALHTIGERCKQ